MQGQTLYVCAHVFGKISGQIREMHDVRIRHIAECQVDPARLETFDIELELEAMPRVHALHAMKEPIFPTLAAEDLQRPVLKPLLGDNRGAYPGPATRDELKERAFPKRKRRHRSWLEIFMLANASRIDAFTIRLNAASIEVHEADIQFPPLRHIRPMIEIARDTLDARHEARNYCWKWLSAHTAIHGCFRWMIIVKACELPAPKPINRPQ